MARIRDETPAALVRRGQNRRGLAKGGEVAERTKSSKHPIARPTQRRAKEVARPKHLDAQSRQELE
jgi:hypothetical protein